LTLTSQEVLGPRFSEALRLAAELHAQQKRKGTDIPYISHLLAVASLALEYGADENEAIAALLHDAIEDAPKELGLEAATVVRRLLEMKFGRCVLDIVEACTDTDIQPKPPWIRRKQTYINGIAQEPPSAVLVSACDKLHNGRAILRDYLTHGEQLWRRFNAPNHHIIGYYRGLTDAFAARAKQLSDVRLRPLAQELNAVVTKLEKETGIRGVWPPAASDLPHNAPS
jgi:GTP pyrophosphokinase